MPDELHLSLATGEALYGVLAVLRARRAPLISLSYTDLRLSLVTASGSGARLAAQLGRRVDVLEVRREASCRMAS